MTDSIPSLILLAMPTWSLLLVVAMLLALAELALPGVFLIWFATAAAATALVVLAIPVMPWWVILLVFALFSTISLMVGYRFYGAKAQRDDEASLLNNRMALQIGRSGIVESAIKYDGGVGRIKLGDTTWSARGPVLAKGDPVTVSGYDGLVLLVEPLP